MSRSPIPEAVRAIVPQTFLARVPKNLVDEILGSGRRVDVERGESLVANTKKPGLTIVVDGLIRVFLKSSETRQITVRYARPGETLGLVHFLRAKLEVHAQPVTDSVLFAISARRLRELAETSAPLAMAIAEDQCTDAKHVFASGFSMGAYFTEHIGCYRNDFRALAPHEPRRRANDARLRDILTTDCQSLSGASKRRPRTGDSGWPPPHIANFDASDRP